MRKTAVRPRRAGRAAETLDPAHASRGAPRRGWIERPPDVSDVTCVVSGCAAIRTVRVNPFIWFDRAGEDHRLGLDEIWSSRKLDPARRLRRAPLIRRLIARGIDATVEEADVEQRASGFDLMRNRGLVTQLVPFFGAGLYALVDTFIVEVYKPLGPLPLGPFVLGAVAAGTAVAKLGRGAPKTERRVIGALTVAACVTATYPATLRFNAATADAEVAVYVSAGGGRFEARDDRLPRIDLSGERIPEYWALFPPGAEHEFTVLRGTAGFHQLELAPFHERTRRFYASDGH